MKINTEMILALEPCSDRKENYLEFYKDFNGSLEDFFKLEKISFHDKIWVSVRLVDKNTQVKFAVKCAEYVLPIFEKVFKDDKRIRNCIEFIKSIDDFNNLNHEQLKLLRFHRDASLASYSSAYAAAASLASYSSAYAAAAAFADAAFADAAFAAAVAASDAAVAASDAASYAAADSAIAAATSAAKLNHNTLQNHYTIFQFLLDLTN